MYILSLFFLDVLCDLCVRVKRRPEQSEMSSDPRSSETTGDEEASSESTTRNQSKMVYFRGSATTSLAEPDHPLPHKKGKRGLGLIFKLF